MVATPHAGTRVVGKVVHYVRANGRSVLARISVLRAVDRVDLEVLPRKTETFTNIDLLAASSDTDVWYKSSRRHP